MKKAIGIFVLGLPLWIIIIAMLIQNAYYEILCCTGIILFIFACTFVGMYLLGILREEE